MRSSALSRNISNLQKFSVADDGPWQIMAHFAVLTLEMAEVVRAVLQAMSDSEGKSALELESDHKPPPSAIPMA